MTKDDKFAQAVRSNPSIARVLRALGRAVVGTNYEWVEREVERLGLDTSHWTKAAPKLRPTRMDASILVTNSAHSTTSAKRVVLRDRLLPYACAECNNLGVWRGQPLVLRLDHINGVSNDHRLENLRFLCPNCDSQSETFCGRNKEPAKEKVCACGAPMHRASAVCRKCHTTRAKPTKIEWPTDAELLQLAAETTQVELGVRLGVSDTAIRKRLARIMRETATPSIIGR